MPDFLTEMKEASIARTEIARASVPDRELMARLEDLEPAPVLRLSDKFDIIAEFKRNAPSAGRLTAKPDEDVSHAIFTAKQYEAGGAAAISILTEPSRFNGSIDDLSSVAKSLNVPVMRKDFLVDPYQVLEARLNGAGGVLLIVRILNDESLLEMTEAALSLGMFAVIESFDANDLERISNLGLDYPGILVGVNTRDLTTLEVDGERLGLLQDVGPANCPRVAESGISTPEDISRVVGLGYDLALIGSSLMKAADPSQLIREMLTNGRKAKRR
ncbi:MAG: indole-3-glycerol-phosphate synthase [Gemmatimonadota bacterium]|nr:indole-3-glycerol-phosphate synthase [Gemmatimonadota bacterium]